MAKADTLVYEFVARLSHSTGRGCYDHKSSDFIT